ncbi:MAG: MFS transporter, partial [Spirochaetes bacterium]|nr:MFS transporter [Spirochaetota bacterium]
GYAMISAYFPEEKRSTMNGIWNAAYPLGAALGIVLGGIIAEKFGWRHAFGVVAIPGLIVALLFFRVRDYRTIDLVREPSTEAASGAARMKAADVIKTIAKTPSLLFTYFGYAGNMFFTVGLITWLPTYYNRIDGLTMDKAGPKASVIMLMAMVGGPLGGFLTDWLRKNIIVQSLLGSSLGPIFIGVISDRYDLVTAFKLLPVFAATSGVLFLAGSFFYERDVKRVDKIVLLEEK